MVLRKEMVMQAMALLAALCVLFITEHAGRLLSLTIG